MAEGTAFDYKGALTHTITTAVGVFFALLVHGALT